MIDTLKLITNKIEEVNFFKIVISYINNNLTLYSNSELTLKKIKNYLIPPFIAAENIDKTFVNVYLIDNFNIDQLNFNFNNGKLIDILANKTHIGKEIVFDSYRVVYNLNTKIVTLINKDLKQIIILGNNNYIFEDAYRIIRELLTRRSEIFGFLRFHSAGFCVKKKAFLLTGNKGAGKTTSLLSFMSESNVAFLSSDKIILKEEMDSILVYGWPQRINCGIGSLKRITLLNEFIPNKFSGNSLEEFWNISEKIPILATKICEKLECQYETNPIKLGGILIPNLIKSDGIECSILKKEEIIKELIRNFMIKDDHSPDWIQYELIDYMILKKRSKNLLKKISSLNIPIYKLNIGVNYTKDDFIKISQKIFDYDR